MLPSGSLGADSPGHVHGGLFSVHIHLCVLAAALSHGVSGKLSSSLMGPLELGRPSLPPEEHLGCNSLTAGLQMSVEALAEFPEVPNLRRC